jgi:predicted dehydrogenase
VHLGVIGVGGMGALHARNAALHIPRAKVVALADPDTARAEEVAKSLGGPRVYSDPAELIGDPAVAAVLVVSPLPTHADWVVAAAAAGKDVFCEKPLGVTVDQARRAAQAVREAGVRLQVAFNRRFDPTYVHAKALIDAGRIGRPVIFKAVTRDRLAPPPGYLGASGGAGILVDTGVHDFDLARWLMGDEVRQVQTSGGILVGHDIADLQGPDGASVNLRFQGGAIGNVETFRGAQYGDDVRTEVVGSQGTLLIGGTARLPVQVMTESGLSREGYPDHFDRFRDSYLMELAAFVDAIVDDSATIVDEEDGVRAVEIAVAARMSLDRDMVAVDLPIA